MLFWVAGLGVGRAWLFRVDCCGCFSNCYGGFSDCCGSGCGVIDLKHRLTRGNLLIRKVNDGGKFGQQVELIPIDRGLCLLESLEDPYFEWFHCHKL
ncbi:putative 1-phosphatidylinositol 4-kinase [Helianthus debilis subsp. tardiflorus]